MGEGELPGTGVGVGVPTPTILRGEITQPAASAAMHSSTAKVNAFAGCRSSASLPRSILIADPNIADTRSNLPPEFLYCTVRVNVCVCVALAEAAVTVSVYVPAGVPVTGVGLGVGVGVGFGFVVPPPPPQPLAITMAANRTSEGMMYASFLAGTCILPAVAQTCLALDLTALLLIAIEKSNPSSASIRLSALMPRRLGGACEAGGNVSARAVVVTPILTMAGVEPDRTTGAAGPAHVAWDGAPVQVIVTLMGPVAPAASASWSV